MSQQKNILGTLAIIFLGAILFTEQDANTWKPIMFMGLIFGVAWYFKK